MKPQPVLCKGAAIGSSPDVEAIVSTVFEVQKMVAQCVNPDGSLKPEGIRALLKLKGTFEDGTQISYDPTGMELKIAVPASVKVTCTTFELTGKLKLTGDMEQTGNQNVVGNVVSSGTNSAHHSHPVSGTVALPVP